MLTPYQIDKVLDFVHAESIYCCSRIDMIKIIVEKEDTGYLHLFLSEMYFTLSQTTNLRLFQI